MPIATPNYPVAIVREAVPKDGNLTPAPFDGIWYHTMPKAILAEIMKTGWDPRANLHSIFGCAVYLSRKPWRLDNQDDRAELQCWLDLAKENTRTGFGEDNTSDELLTTLAPPVIELKGSVKKVGRTAQKGDKPQNIAVRDYFLENDVRAIHFREREEVVVAVFDPTCIRIIP